MGVGGNDNVADLLVGEEFDAGVGEDPEKSGGVAAKETPEAVGGVNTAYGGGEA